MGKSDFVTVFIFVAQREHAEQVEKEALTFRPSLATTTTPRARSPSPKRERSSLELSTSNISSDTTPLRPNYHLGDDHLELDQPAIVMPSPSSPKVFFFSSFLDCFPLVAK